MTFTGTGGMYDIAYKSKIRKFNVKIGIFTFLKKKGSGFTETISYPNFNRYLVLSLNSLSKQHQLGRALVLEDGIHDQETKVEMVLLFAKKLSRRYCSSRSAVERLQELLQRWPLRRWVVKALARTISDDTEF